jgi:hypothetical protein
MRGSSDNDQYVYLFESVAPTVNTYAGWTRGARCRHKVSRLEAHVHRKRVDGAFLLVRVVTV